jgi:hypothetical protein
MESSEWSSVTLQLKLINWEWTCAGRPFLECGATTWEGAKGHVCPDTGISWTPYGTGTKLITFETVGRAWAG